MGLYEIGQYVLYEDRVVEILEVNDYIVTNDWDYDVRDLLTGKVTKATSLSKSRPLTEMEVVAWHAQHG